MATKSVCSAQVNRAFMIAPGLQGLRRGGGNGADRCKRPPGLLAMRRWLAECRPDVINTHSLTDSWLAGLARCDLAHPPPSCARARHISAPIAVNASSRWLYGRLAQHVVTHWRGPAVRNY